jgi:choline kinase
MVVIILAAGKGKRLNTGSNKKNIPKCLVELNNSRTILELNIEKILSFSEIKHIYLVTGYKHKLVEDFLGATFPYQKNIKTVYNPNFNKSVVYSVKKGFKNINKSDPMLLLNGDTYFDKDIFRQSIELSKKNHNTITLFGYITNEFYDDDMLINVVDGKMLNVGKDLKKTNGVSSGAILMCNRGLQKYLDTINLESIDQLKTHHSILQFISDSGFDIDFADLGKRTWLEVDEQADLDRASKYFGIN